MTSPGSELPHPAEIDDSVVVKARYDDAISNDSRTLVLVDNMVMLLSETGSAALEHAKGGITVGELGARLLAEFGVPPGQQDVAYVTRQIIAALEWRGLLERLP